MTTLSMHLRIFFHFLPQSDLKKSYAMFPLKRDERNTCAPELQPEPQLQMKHLPLLPEQNVFFIASSKCNLNPQYLNETSSLKQVLNATSILNN
jgi:hypothetical protein